MYNKKLGFANQIIMENIGGIIMESINYKATQIDEKSWRIEDTMVCFYLFEGSDKALLVDTGVSGGDVRGFAESLTDKPLILVNTHSDPDHTSGNEAFEYSYMHLSEFARYAAKEVKGAAPRPLWDGDVIDIGGRAFEVVLIPGHTPGSIALLDRENRILISGDTVSNSHVFIFGEGRSLPALIESLKKLEALSSAFDGLYPSHGSAPLGTEAITAQLEAAELLLAGKLTPQDPPAHMPFPAKMYVHGPATFFM